MAQTSFGDADIPAYEVVKTERSRTSHVSNQYVTATQAAKKL